MRCCTNSPCRSRKGGRRAAPRAGRTESIPSDQSHPRHGNPACARASAALPRRHQAIACTLVSSADPIIFRVGGWLMHAIRQGQTRFEPRRLVMSTNSSTTRRSVLAASAAASVVSLLPTHLAAQGGARPSQRSKQGDSKMATKDEIRPFSFHAPEAELTDLRKRINATKWPEREQVTDDS